MAYRLDLLPESLLHPVFHVSTLKKKLGHSVSPFSTLPPVDRHGDFQHAPVQISEGHLVKRRGRAVSEVLVRWSGSSADDDTWELLWSLQNQFPHLVGKVL